jgi:hypothetical protein
MRVQVRLNAICPYQSQQSSPAIQDISAPVIQDISAPAIRDSSPAETCICNTSGGGGGEWKLVDEFFLFVLIILYSLYLEYDSPLLPSASGLAG